MMEKNETMQEQTCPRCGRTYTDRPAVSRDDNTTLICPDCGIREALRSIGVKQKEQDEILEIIHRKGVE